MMSETPGSETVNESAADTPEAKPIERVFLTGATGFVGRYVLRELVSRGYTARLSCASAGSTQKGVGRVGSDAHRQHRGIAF